MVGAFFDEKYTKKPWFYNRKMNWTFLFILVQVHSISELSSVQVLSAKKWTEFSSKFTKKVNFWTELNFSVQFSHFLASSTITKKMLLLDLIGQKKSSIFLWLQQQHTEHMCGVTISSSRPIKSYFGLCNVQICCRRIILCFFARFNISFAFGLQSRYINWKFLLKHVN